MEQGFDEMTLKAYNPPQSFIGEGFQEEVSVLTMMLLMFQSYVRLVRCVFVLIEMFSCPWTPEPNNFSFVEEDERYGYKQNRDEAQQ